VQAPADFVFGASGVEIERTSDSGTQQVTYAAGPVRDFYIAGSYDFTVKSQEVNGVTFNSYAKPGQESGQAIALNTAVNVFALFDQLLGEYPYSEFDIVNAPMLAYGVEYPGITNIYDDLYRMVMEEDPTGALLTTLEVVIAHEAAHQWFYNMVGNDQQEHPWLDEAVAQYITYLYVFDQHGEATAQAANVANWQFRLGRVEDNEMAIGLPSGDYQGYEYSGIVYGRGPLFFLELEETYGQQIVVDGLHDYFQDNLWEIGDQAELRASLEDACECDLSELFAQWIDS
jgi:aminopeptidase N